MNSDDVPAPSRPEPNELKQPWRQPVIEYLNLASSENGADTIPIDGFGNSS
jgi:hypothetical protein